MTRKPPPSPQLGMIRQIIETRLGRPLGPLATMPRDLRDAVCRLALQLVRMPK